MRIFLVITGCLLALLLMAALGGWWWWRQNGDSLVGAAGDGLRDGTAQGKAGSARECYDTGLAALESCRSFDCGIYNHAHAAGCFANTQSDGGLCDDVPRDLGVVASMQWVAARCADVAADSSSCQGLMQSTLDYCAADAP